MFWKQYEVEIRNVFCFDLEQYFVSKIDAQKNRQFWRLIFLQYSFLFKLYCGLDILSQNKFDTKYQVWFISTANQ
jgi:hypothetical protein